MQFWRYLYVCRNQVFFIFENVIGTTKNFRNRRKFFSSSGKYYFLQNVRYIQWNLNFEIVSIYYFLRKTAGSCFLINLKLNNVLTALLAFLALSKNKNSKASRLIVGTPRSFKCYLCLSVWCVCFVYLHHFYQYYLCFAGRT